MRIHRSASNMRVGAHNTTTTTLYSSQQHPQLQIQLISVDLASHNFNLTRDSCTAHKRDGGSDPFSFKFRSPLRAHAGLLHASLRSLRLCALYFRIQKKAW